MMLVPADALYIVPRSCLMASLALIDLGYSAALRYPLILLPRDLLRHHVEMHHVVAGRCLMTLRGLFVFALLLSCGLHAQDYFQQWVDYHIEVTLDERARHRPGRPADAAHPRQALPGRPAQAARPAAAPRCRDRHWTSMTPFRTRTSPQTASAAQSSCRYSKCGRTSAFPERCRAGRSSGCS